jgi:hypothetical protein
MRATCAVRGRPAGGHKDVCRPKNSAGICRNAFALESTIDVLVVGCTLRVVGSPGLPGYLGRAWHVLPLLRLWN